ncbi:MAG: tetratricopeptide repeat protein [Planctomycetaceae bacterium]|nr:tetratricopeptide repeat protein [Planctomycetaceae bacterium]
MIGSFRPIVLGLAWAASTLVAPEASADPPQIGPGTSAKSDGAATFALPGEDAPQPFVSAHPRSVEDQGQIEALRDYSTARALEDQKNWSEAITLLEKALKADPDSTAIPRRLSRLYFGRGETEQAIRYSNRVLEADPGDTATISRLVVHFLRKNDVAGAVTVLKDVLANPKLEPHSSGRILAEYELGKLYANKLQQPELAADMFAKVVAALDEKAANRLSPHDQARILGSDEAATYLEFGQVFLNAKRYDLAIQAFERGLVYNEDDPQLPLLLAETLLKTGKGEEALAIVERFLKRQPQGGEGYDLQARILTALHREDEITPRLERAARLDSKNLPLQYALADRYREIGQVDRAEALYKELLSAQPTPLGYRALAASLLKRKRTEDLLRVLAEAWTKPNGFDAVKPQVEAIIKDTAFADEVLETGYKMLSATPPTLDPPAVKILAAIAAEANKLDKLEPIQRLVLRENPSPQGYREMAQLLDNLRRHADAAATLEEMMTRYPDEKNPRMLTLLGQLRRLANQNDRAIEAFREALKIDPNETETQALLGLTLSQADKPDEALEVFRGALKNDPANPALNRLYGGVLTQFGRNDEAIAFYKGLLDRYPNSEEIVHLAHSGLSVVYVNLGDFSKGEAELETLLERNPDEAGVNNDLGYLYADQGKNLEKAEAMIRKALLEEPKNAAYLDSLGWVLFKRGKLKEAIEQLERATQNLTGGGDATIYEHLGDVYLRLQETAKTKAAWERAEQAAAKAVPPDKRLPEIRKKLESLGRIAPAPKPAADDTP